MFENVETKLYIWWGFNIEMLSSDTTAGLST